MARKTPEYPKPVFAIHLEAAMRVKPFISDERTRYYLEGVYVQPHKEGALCTATDGHRLGVRLDRGGFCAEPTIFKLPPEIKMPRKSLLFTAPWLVGIATAPGRGHISLVDRAPKKDDDTPGSAIERVEDCALRIGNAFIDGTYPDWRRVIPKLSDKDVIRGFNGDYVKAFGRYVTMRGADDTSPHLIRIASEPDFVGVLMPMRPSDATLPDWIAQPADKEG